MAEQSNNKNFPVQVDGQEFWVSRSLACGLIAFAFDANKRLHVLVNKRGQGCKFYKGVWNVPGGFIDYNEDAPTCACREAYEETGVVVDPAKVVFLDLDTTPHGGRQSMTARFVHLFDEPLESIVTTNEHSEPDEVDEIRWMPCDTQKDIDNLENVEWARGQVHYIKMARNALFKMFPGKIALKYGIPVK